MGREMTKLEVIRAVEDNEEGWPTHLLKNFRELIKLWPELLYDRDDVVRVRDLARQSTGAYQGDEDGITIEGKNLQWKSQVEFLGNTAEA